MFQRKIKRHLSFLVKLKMRTSIFLLLGLFFISQACERENLAKDMDSDLLGLWMLESITGGFTGAGHQVDFTDVEFRQDGSYRINNHDEAKGEGRFTLNTFEDKLVLRLSSRDSLKIPFEEHEKTVILNREKLILNDPCCDLYQYTFKKDLN